MANPLKNIMSNPVMQARILRLKVVVAGLALDFWKDTPFPKKEKKIKVMAPPKPKAASLQKENLADSNKSMAPKPWVADKIQIIEKLWGEGNVFPGGDEYVDNFTTPLGLNHEMSVLDLNAGLGGLARKLARESNVYVTGLEPNKLLASRGMVMSIAAGKSKQATVTYYDPAEYIASRKYDCVFARELFFRIIGKEKFFHAVSESVKSKGGQIVFTDYILEEKDKDKPAILKWLSVEKTATPLSYIAMVKEWKGLGFDLRVAEDQTMFYRSEILRSLAVFVEFMTMNIPSLDTKPMIVREINLWALRIAAFDSGLRYCRFYGIKY